MKKTDKTALTAAIFAAALNAVPMGAAAYDPAEEPIQDVYGPPPVEREHICEKCGYSWDMLVSKRTQKTDSSC